MMLCLPAPTHIEPGCLVQFSEKGLAGLQGHLRSHWARRYGNGVGRVIKTHDWGIYKTALVAFPHREECWRFDDLERVNNTERTVAPLKHFVAYGKQS